MTAVEAATIALKVAFADASDTAAVDAGGDDVVFALGVLQAVTNTATPTTSTVHRPACDRPRSPNFEPCRCIPDDSMRPGANLSVFADP